MPTNLWYTLYNILCKKDSLFPHQLRKEDAILKQVVSLNQNWAFLKDCESVPAAIPAGAARVDLPHCWNALDGQDGGNDYWRGVCCYLKTIERPAGKNVYIEVEAASSVGRIFVNGVEKASHKGGYSLFRANVTDALRDGENLIAIQVDNSPRTDVYPQTADFTFYGGLYRGVNLITTEDSHFDLDYFGGSGMAVSAVVDGCDAIVSFDAYITNPDPQQSVEFRILDAMGGHIANAVRPAAEKVHADVRVEDVHLWQGVQDPYLYQTEALLTIHNETLDRVTSSLGVRTYTVDPQKGFFLNGVLTPLRGVSRHQDRLGVGNALTKEDHEEDVRFIREVGANTVRLAHYQHSQYFYDACDRAGLIVWAEIPFISVMSKDPAAHENCRSQLTELIVQNFNHPSICFWGISNEITIGGQSPQLIENLRDLNSLAKSLDATRLTTIAHVSMVPMENEMHHITDVLSYNHYFGWYGGEMGDNEVWLDKFHALHPDRPLGISEYGAEGIVSYHNDAPRCKDYSEEYQALYHEHMAKIIDERPWLWATHVWNMFDFGCDARNEGGVMGRNNKGLMTIDRMVRKDAFYLYKAYWSEEAFVHLCGRRYAQRVGEETTVKVYSNLSKVALYINGTLFAEKKGSHVFTFEHVPLGEGFTSICAKAVACADAMTLERVAQPNPTYTYVDPDADDESDGAANWFNLDDYKDSNVDEIIVNEGCFSVRDTIGEIIENDAAGKALEQYMRATTGMKVKRTMLGMMKDATLESMMNIAQGMMTGNRPPEETRRLLIQLNEVLNKIPK